MLFHRLLMALAIALLAFYGAAPALANGKDISFEADTVSVNDEDGSMLAVGNVQMKQAGMTLTADEVRYNRDSDRAVANGNVVFVDADGAIHKSDMMVLDTEFTHIVADTLRSRYPDGSFFIADSGDIKTDSISVFDGSRFSPCDCEFENGEPQSGTLGRHRPATMSRQARSSIAMSACIFLIYPSSICLIWRTRTGR